MSEEILINVTPQETRAAVVENGVLQEVFIERRKGRGIVGNIYRGKVCRVLPGMQAAFIDIGLERAAFLHASDILNASNQRIGAVQNTPGESAIDTPEILIQQLLHEGKDLMVQVIKDPIGTKGARLTTQITIPSRYLVYMPQCPNIGVSAKIEEDEVRKRIRETMASILPEGTGGCIVRTVAENVSQDVLRQDILFLQKIWESIREEAQKGTPPCLVHEDLPLALRLQRDLVGANVEKVRIDSRETCQRVEEFVQCFVPEMIGRIEHYPGERPIFELYNVEEEIQKALNRRVELKSGGYLIFDQTEAMTTVDVNTGAYVGHRNLEETIFKTNLEAAQAIARQLRLRNLGGIIIIDFIDMTQEDHKRQVLRALEKALEGDHTKNSITEVSSLGLVEMTRKRTTESLEHVLCEPCHCCAGRGTIKTTETVCFEIYRDILREARQYADVGSFLVLASQSVVDRLLDEESTSVAELETFINKPIRLQAEILYSQEQFDIVLM